MTINHHPLDDTLMAYMAGTLDAGRRFVIGAHLLGCERCRRSVALLEHAAGQMLEEIEPVAMSESALSAALQQLDRPASPPEIGLSATQLSDVMASPDRGPWTWVGPGVHMRPLHKPKSGGTRVFLLKAAPGLGLPQHTHTGSELTQVLSGAFAHTGGRFGPGDIDDADDADEHNPLVEPGQACVCLVAMDGHLKLRGLLGRIMQPFVRL